MISVVTREVVQIEDIWYSAWKEKRRSSEDEEEINADVDHSIAIFSPCTEIIPSIPSLAGDISEYLPFHSSMIGDEERGYVM